VSIRLQLLLMSLTTLILPWAGCQYAREVQTVLRASQEQALLASAGTIANALSAQPQRLFHSAEASGRFDAGGGDIYAFPLRTTPLLDGYRDDWDVSQKPLALPSTGGYRAKMQTGVTDRYLYVYLEVEDPHFDPQGGGPGATPHGCDRVELALQSPDGAVESYFFATSAPGMVAAQSIVQGDDGRASVVIEPRIQGFWLQTAGGYHLEFRVPLALVGARLWIEAIDGADEPQRHAGTLDGAEKQRGGRLFFSSGSLLDWLTPFIRNGTRATVIDANALKLATAGSSEATEVPSEDAPNVAWYRRFQAIDTAELPLRKSLADRLEGPHVNVALKGHPQAQWFRVGKHNEIMLAAAAPIVVNGETLGAVVLEQAGDQLLGLRDRALSRLFNLTLTATGIAVAFVLGFATWLSLRIGKLRDAADTAVAADGRIKVDMPDASARDELGALSRSFTRMLTRLSEHTQYLRTLGGKLSHELRTPLTIVKSSLDNLELEGVGSNQKVYLSRARAGAERLQLILAALGAAARVEESIKQADRVNFDLKELLVSAVGAYRDGFAGAHFNLDLPDGVCHLRGAPELIVQMLDKLVENAVDFTPPTGAITIGLSKDAALYRLTVSNDGSVIPEELLGRLFESLFEVRDTKDDKPHLGLGLYIVRLIAEFHGGGAAAANRADGSGVVFTISLPMI
jgi:two-component system, OmpR family, sensor histidine kinase ChvG